VNVDNIGPLLDHFSYVPISGVMFVGAAGVAGMFMGRSISMSTSPSLTIDNTDHLPNAIANRVVEVIVGAP
jgi:hypothetical protein